MTSMVESHSHMEEVKPPETVSIANSLVPTFADDGKKAHYLSYRIANFSFRESCELGKVSEKQVRRWRAADENFNHLDTEGLTELRKQMANEYLDMQFTRNFHLILQKDFRVLYKDATQDVTKVPLTESEDKYLDKIRQHYTPQSLAMVKQLLGGGTVEQPFNFTELSFKIKRESLEITQTRKIE